VTLVLCFGILSCIGLDVHAGHKHGSKGFWTMSRELTVCSMTWARSRPRRLSGSRFMLLRISSEN